MCIDINAWFKHLFDKKDKVEQPEIKPEPEYNVNIPVCVFSDTTHVYNVPAGKYFIIDDLKISDKNATLCDGYQRFIFRINDNNSHKVDDIICYGMINTKYVHFRRIESKINKCDDTGIPVGHMDVVYDRGAEVIVEYIDSNKNLTLREIVNMYFPTIQLSKIRYFNAYRFTLNNIIPSNKHTTHSFINPFMLPINPMTLNDMMDTMHEKQ